MEKLPLPNSITKLLDIPYKEMDTYTQKCFLCLVSELLNKSRIFEDLIKDEMVHLMEHGNTPAKIMQFVDFTELEKLDITSPIEQA